MTATERNGKLVITLGQRIDTNNAPQIEKEVIETVNAHAGTDVVFDAEKLEYISSSGLRILMKVVKKTGKPVDIINVSAEVYEIFDVTGFTELMNVQTNAELSDNKPMREISIEGKEMIGRYSISTFYRLDEETVVKVFDPGTRYDTVIQKESENARNAFVAGVPTVIPFDDVKVGNCYGKVYEMQNCRFLLDVIANDKAHLDDYIRRFAKTVKKMHSIEVDSKKFSPFKKNMLEMLPLLSKTLNAEETEKVKSIIENIPDRNTFLLGICRLDLAILQNNEILFYDLGMAAFGHPITDLFIMYYDFGQHGKFAHSTIKEPIKRFTHDEMDLIWKIFITEYLGTDDMEFIKKVERQIDMIGLARTLFLSFLSLIDSKNRIDETYENIKNQLFNYFDKGLEPICF